MENINSLVENYKNKMRLLYGCEVDIEIEGNNVRFIGIQNYKDSKFIMPKFVTIIGRGAFMYNDCIEEIDVGENTIEIEDRAFERCNELRKIKLDNVKKLGDGVFNNCTELEEIHLNKDIKKISKGLFSWCMKLKNVYCGDIEVIEDRAFSYTSVNESILKSSLKHIGTEAFTGCSGMERVKIPGSVKEIGDKAFAECEWIESLEVSEGVKEIPMGAFDYCYDIQEVEMPLGLIIYKNSFENTVLKVIGSKYSTKYLGLGLMRICNKEGD